MNERANPISDKGVQHDDHCWITAGGRAWSIRRMHRDRNGRLMFHLWRGYAPHIEMALIDMTEFRVDDYVRKAVALLAAQTEGGSHGQQEGTGQQERAAPAERPNPQDKKGGG